MSVLRKPKARNSGATWERVWSRLVGSPRCTRKDRKPRRLMVDPLETRMLLSVVPVNLTDMQINQSIINGVNLPSPVLIGNPQASTNGSAADYPMLGGKSVATDNNGDFVTVWAQNDGTSWTDPATGLVATDSNIYARYFTDAMQRIDLPVDAQGKVDVTQLPVDLATGQHYFALKYNGNEVDELDITEGNQPFATINPLLMGSFTFTWAGAVTGSVNYFSFDNPNNTAAAIQGVLQGMGVNELSDVTVTAVNAQKFLINYGANSGGHPINQVTVSCYDALGNSTFPGAYLPSVDLAPQRLPGATANIFVSAIDPSITAANIQFAFSQTSQNVQLAPVFLPPTAFISPTLYNYAPYTAPITTREAMPGVTVTARTTSEFDITFTGDGGLNQQPLMAVVDDTGTPIDNASVELLKQSSDVFRVNSPEPDNPLTNRPDVYDQTAPQVAMDANGNFVITWQSVVPDSINQGSQGSVSDIFARRFSPAGWVDDTYRDITFTPSDPNATDLSGSFILTTGKGITGSLTFDSTDLETTRSSMEDALHTLGYDAATTVTIQSTDPSAYVLRVNWGGNDLGTEPLIESSPVSDPTGMVQGDVATSSAVPFLADMNHDGIADTPIESVRALGDEFQVNTLTTNAQTRPSVGMDGNGNFTIAWETGGQELSYFNNIEAQRFDRDGNAIGNEFNVDTTNNNTTYSFQPYVGVSHDGATVISWSNTNDPNYFLGNTFAVSLNCAVYGADGTVLVPSQGLGAGGADASICFDANDDFVITYDHTGVADNITRRVGVLFEGAFAQEYQIYDPVTHAFAYRQIRAEFQVNTANLGGTSTSYWPGGHMAGGAGMDADGDLTINYWGPGGPDMSEFSSGQVSQIPNSYNIATIDPSDGSIRYVDVDGYINMWLLYDQVNLGYTAAQLAAVRSQMEGIYPYTPAILYIAPNGAEEVANAGLLRGANYSIEFSQFDASATQGPNILGTNSVANANRGDQTNATYMLAIDDSAVSGSIVLSVSAWGGQSDVTITPTFLTVGGRVVGINAAKTATAIETALKGAGALGKNWPDGANSQYQGPVSVRLVPVTELAQRAGTALDPTNYWAWSDGTAPPGVGPNGVGYDVYEITFMGESHDFPVSVSISTTANNPISLKLPSPSGGGNAPPADVGGPLVEVYGNYMSVLDQYPSMAMTDSGNFVMVWNRETIGTDFASLTYSLQYRTFQESTDTAGPSVVGWFNPADGTSVTPAANQTQLTQIEAPGGLKHLVISFDEPMYDAPEMVQTLTFAPVAPVTAGTFKLQMGNLTSAALSFNPTNPASMVSSLQSAIDALAGGAGGVTVVYKGKVGGNPTFQVTFGGSYTGVNEPLIGMAALDSTITYRGTISAIDKTGDRVTNPANYLLFQGTGGTNSLGTQIPNGVVHVSYGMNEASLLAASDPTDYGDLNVPASNRYEAVLTFDANADPTDGFQPLGNGTYTVQVRHPIVDQNGVVVQNGLRDVAANALGHNGFQPAGIDFQQAFSVLVTTATPSQDTLVSNTTPQQAAGYTAVNGRTYPETPGAVAVDADGDHIVVWSATDTTPDPVAGHALDRVYVQQYNIDGTPYGTAIPVTDPFDPDSADFLHDDQRYATVACDAGGDFVVTWTNIRNGQQDIYARQFNSAGQPLGAAFAVTATADEAFKPTYANVAMDELGAFVITWSSYGQEDGLGAQTGEGWGVYARRYDSSGNALSPEFHVNVTTAGDQQNSTVAMANDGRFVIAWRSSQGGVADNIITRCFNPDGSPVQTNTSQGYLFGELLVNDPLFGATSIGNQRYPDVALSANGQSYVVTWQTSGTNSTAWDICSRQFVWPSSTPLTQPITHAFAPLIAPTIPDGVDDFSQSIDFPENVLISDVNVTLNITTPHPQTLEGWLESPSGQTVILFDRQKTAGANFIGTVFDDQANQSINAGQAPFTGLWQPLQSLSVFNGQISQGTWTLHIHDYSTVVAAVPQQFLNGWSITITPATGGPQVVVNTTTQGDQIYPSVAMATNGSYMIAWSGFGNQPGQKDDSGVFYQRFDLSGKRIGSETRANLSDATNPRAQKIPSVGSDANGNVIIAWTGAGATPGTTDVYKMSTASVSGPIVDTSGPIVTDVWYQDPTQPALSQLLDAGVVLLPDSTGPGVTQFTVAFSEKLDAVAATDASSVKWTHSVTNPQNWILYLDGSEVSDAVTHVDFALDPTTRKYEATLTLNAPLAAGEYTLVARDNIWDTAYLFEKDPSTGVLVPTANALDGDYDGVPGTNPKNPLTGTQPGYQISFTAAVSAPVPNYNSENRVNAATGYVDYLSPSLGTGYAVESNRRTMAVDHSGDFAVVWTRTTSDTGADVYVRVFDRNNNPLTGDVLVNQYTAGDQIDPTIAMDAVGDFVVVWASQQPSPIGQDLSDGSWDIYARQFNSMGTPLGDEFRVNTETANDQSQPAVAMDSFGNFTIVWATKGQNFSYFNDIKGQMFNFDGSRKQNEFQVNASAIAIVGPMNTAIPNINPAIAMSDRVVTPVLDAQGNLIGTSTIQDFIVTWDAENQQTNGVGVNTYIDAVLYTLTEVKTATLVATGTGTSTQTSWNLLQIKKQFQVDDSTVAGAALGASDAAREARNSQVVMDSLGNFTVTWESFSDADPAGVTSYGVHYRRFDPTGAPLAASAEANQLFGVDPNSNFTGAQVNASIAMDADGDYAVAWDGNGAQPFVLDGNAVTSASVGNMDSQGVWIRSYASGTDQPVTTESRVNSTVAGDQKFASIAMTPDGDIIVAWQGNGVGDPTGIYFRRYPKTTDTAGPMVVTVTLPDGSQIPQLPATTTVANPVTIPNSVRRTQDIQFAPPPGANHLSGAFQLSITIAKAGVLTPLITSNIAFDSSDLATAAANLQNALVALGADPTTTVTVQSAPGATPYVLRITWANAVDAATKVVSTIVAPVPQSAPYLVVTFDENMMTSGPDSVTNLNNWSLTTGGVATAISQIYFGLNENHVLYPDKPITNKWEAVLLLNPQSPLTDGTYTLTALAPKIDANGFYQSGLRDTAGNALGHTGYVPNGADFTFDFTVSVPVPTVSEVDNLVASTQSRQLVTNGAALGAPVTQFIVVFSQDMSQVGGTSGPHSVTNPNNWSLTLNGNPIVNAVSSIAYDPTTYEATVTLAQPLVLLPGNNNYTLTALDFIQDANGVQLDGNGDGLPGGNFTRTFSIVPASTQGPRVVGTYDLIGVIGATATREPVVNGTALDPPVTQFAVTFDKDMSQVGGATGANSVINPNNWSLTFDGAPIINPITSITYDPTTREATLIFATAQPLGAGNYVLTAFGTLQDAYGNALDGNADGINGDNFTRAFSIRIDTTVNTTPIGDTPAMATDANGDYVIAWVGYGQDGDAAGVGNIYAQRYNKTGKPQGLQFLVNSYTTNAQIAPAVAMSASGAFVIAWSGEGADDLSGVYARAFGANGTPVGNQFRVNQYITSIQNQPSVAIDTGGDVVITWTSFGQPPDSDIDGVWARRFNLQGIAKSDEFLVNTYTKDRQDHSDVAMDANGNFTVVWQSFGQDGSDWGIYGQRYNAANVKLGGEFRINTFTTNAQDLPKVAMDPNGDFVVTWESLGQDGSGEGIYARRYSPAGAPLDASDTLVNRHTAGFQVTPDVAMDSKGNYIITWSTFGQDGKGDPPNQDYGIFARAFKSDGSDFPDPTTGKVDEIPINATVLGDQVTPVIAVDPNRDYAIAWVGPAGAATGIYAYFNDPVSSGPTISNVVVALYTSPPVITWSAADPAGLGAMSLKVDGKAVSTIYDPYGTKTAADYAGAIGILAPGNHTYVIQAANTASSPLSTQYTGSFAVPISSNGPTINQVVVAISAATPVITWSAVDTAGIAKTTLQVDGKLVSAICGPYGTYYAGILPKLTAGSHTYVIQATNAASTPVSMQYTGTFSVATNQAPTIGSVVVALTNNPPVITWEAADADGIASTSLTVDGKSVGGIYGPYGTKYDGDYAGMLGTLAAGNHTFAIHVTDSNAAPASADYTGSFTVAATQPALTNPAPIIDSVVVALTNNPPVITWSAADADGIASASLTVDGKSVGGIYGPYGTKYDGDYAGMLGTLAAGNHTFAIHVTDSNAVSASADYTGSFTVAATQPGPTIGSVVVALTNNPPVITWSVADADGISATSITIDGKNPAPVFGPYGTKYAADYGSALGALAAGSHTYVIHATNAAGVPVSTQLTGSFTVAAATTVQAPSITNIVIAEYNGNGDGIIQANEQFIVSWTAIDPDGIFSTSASVDTLPAKAVYGPYGNDYSAVFNPLTAGNHTIAIKATDNSSAHLTLQIGKPISIAQVAAAFAQSSLTQSAKTDWLLNLDGLTTTSGTDNKNANNAVDAVLAAS